MKKKVRVYKPTQMAQQGAQVQGQPQQVQQQQQPNPEVLVGVATQSLMQGTPPDELYNALVKQGIEPQIANQIVSQAVELINANQPEPGVEPQNIEDAEQENVASVEDETQQRNNTINDIIMGEEDDSYLYETNPELLADDEDEEMKCGGMTHKQYGGVLSKKSYVNNAMKLAKKQMGGQDGGNKADITDTAKGDRSMIKPNFLAGVKDTAMTAQLKQQAEMQYDMLMNQNQAPEGMYPMAQRGGQQRRQDRQMNRFYRNMSNMMPSSGLQGGSGQFNIMNFTGGNPNMQSMQQGMVNPHGISHIDVRKSGLFGRPRQYSIDFFQNQQASTVYNGIPRELPGKSTAGTTTKQTAKPEAKPRKLYIDDAAVSSANPTGTGTGGTGTGSTPTPTTPEVSEVFESGIRPGYFDTPNFTDPWKDAMSELYNPEQADGITNIQDWDPLQRAQYNYMQNQIMAKPQAAMADDELIQNLALGAAGLRNALTKTPAFQFKPFMKGFLPKGNPQGMNPIGLPGPKGPIGGGAFSAPGGWMGGPKGLPYSGTFYMENGGFLPEYAIAGQISPENIPVQILDKAGNVTGMTTQGRAETQGLKYRIAPANNKNTQITGTSWNGSPVYGDAGQVNRGMITISDNKGNTKSVSQDDALFWNNTRKDSPDISLTDLSFASEKPVATKPNTQQYPGINPNYSPYAKYPPLFGRDTRGMSLRNMISGFNPVVQYAGSWGQQQGPPRDAQGNVYTGSMANPQLSRIDVTKSGLFGRPKRYTMDFGVPGTSGSGQGIHTGSSPTTYRGSDGQIHTVDNRNINQAQTSPRGITNLADSAGMTDAQYEAQFTDDRGGRGKAADFFYNLNKGDRSGLFDKIGAKLEPHQNLQFPDAKPDAVKQRAILGPPDVNLPNEMIDVQPENLIAPPPNVQLPNPYIDVQPEMLNDPYAPGPPEAMQYPMIDVQGENIPSPQQTTTPIGSQVSQSGANPGIQYQINPTTGKYEMAPGVYDNLNTPTQGQPSPTVSPRQQGNNPGIQYQINPQTGKYEMASGVYDNLESQPSKAAPITSPGTNKGIEFYQDPATGEYKMWSDTNAPQPTSSPAITQPSTTVAKSTTVNNPGIEFMMNDQGKYEMYPGAGAQQSISTPNEGIQFRMTPSGKYEMIPNTPVQQNAPTLGAPPTPTTKEGWKDYLKYLQNRNPIDQLPTVPSGLDPNTLQNYFNNPNIQSNVPDYGADNTFQDWQMRNYGNNSSAYDWQSGQDMLGDGSGIIDLNATPQERKANRALQSARNVRLTENDLVNVKPNSKEAIQIANDYLTNALNSKGGYKSKEMKEAIKNRANLMVTNPNTFGSTVKGNKAKGWKRDPRPGRDSYMVSPVEYNRIIRNNPDLASRQIGGETPNPFANQSQCPSGYRKNAQGQCEQIFTGQKDFGYTAPTTLGGGSDLPNPFANTADTNPITGQPTGAQHFDATGQQYENKGLQYPGSDPDAFSVDFKNKNMYDVDFESGVNQFNMFANIGAGLLEDRANRGNLKRTYDRTNADEQYASQTGYDRGWYDPNSGLIDEMGFTGLAQRGGQMPGQETYMSDEQIRQFLADGGEIEFI